MSKNSKKKLPKKSDYERLQEILSSLNSQKDTETDNSSPRKNKIITLIIIAGSILAFKSCYYFPLFHGYGRYYRPSNSVHTQSEISRGGFGATGHSMSFHGG